MPVYDRNTIPQSVGRGILDPELAAWLPTGPTLGHAYALKLAAAGNDLTYVHNPDLTHGFPQFTRYSKACHQATEELADLLRARIG